MAKRYFPGWTCRFYIDDKVPVEIVQTLNSMGNAEVIAMGNVEKQAVVKQQMYWRMYVASDPSVDVCIIRDSDAWLSKRDSIMVNEWLDSDKDFHIIRDHCHHRSPVMGGTWGARNGIVSDIIEVLETYIKEGHAYDAGTDVITTNDQVFLNAMIYKRVLPNTFIHGIQDPFPMEGESHAVATPAYSEEDNLDDYPLIDTGKHNGQGACSECKLGEHVAYVGSVLHYLPDSVNANVNKLIADRVDHKRIISYSLYNQRPKDTLNAIFNCMLAPHIYPGWICRFYVDETISKGIRALLETFDHVEIVDMERHRASEAMLWRFHPASDPTVDVMISRDADSWLSAREAKMVNDWLASDKDFHIMRDHCYHSQKIMGGVWGARNHVIPQMKELADKFSESETYDQGFLAEQIYPLVAHTLFVHDPHTKETHVIPRDQGYHTDGCLPIPDYIEYDEPIDGLSFKEVNAMNSFKCYHCEKVHETFVGGIMEKIPERALDILRAYIEKHDITDSVESL